MSLESQCEVTVTGPLARSAIDAIGRRFQIVATRSADTTTVTVEAVDQAAVRALLTMLWDSGHEVRAMSTHPTRPCPEMVLEGVQLSR